MYVLRWARCSEIGQIDDEKVREIEWAGGDDSEIRACIKEEIDSKPSHV